MLLQRVLQLGERGLHGSETLLRTITKAVEGKEYLRPVERRDVQLVNRLGTSGGQRAKHATVETALQKKNRERISLSASLNDGVGVTYLEAKNGQLRRTGHLVVHARAQLLGGGSLTLALTEPTTHTLRTSKHTRTKHTGAS